MLSPFTILSLTSETRMGLSVACDVASAMVAAMEVK